MSSPKTNPSVGKTMKRILVLVLVCGLGSFVAARVQAPAPPTNVRLVTGANVLSSSELVPLGVFASPNSGTTSSSFQLPVTGRYEADGKFHYLQVRGDGSIGEFTEPTLAPM